MIKTLLKLSFPIILTFSLNAQNANYLMHYSEPASNFLSPSPRIKPNTKDFMQEALPIGNGHLGAMFSGGIDEDLIVINDITAWAGSTRGAEPFEQTGTPKESYKQLDRLREMIRDSKFGKSKDSVENFATKHFSAKMNLGNYAAFSDLMIHTGHKPSDAKNYKRSLDLRNGVGYVSYEIGEAKFKREIFCSYPMDIIAIRYTSEGVPLDLKIENSSKHKNTICNIFKNKIELLGKIPLAKKDFMEFKQVLYINSDKAKISNDDKFLYVKDSNEVIIYLTGYTDYLPVYPRFKGRNFKEDCDKTMAKALASNYEEIKANHIKDVSSIIDRCTLSLGYKSANITTDKLIRDGESLELSTLYFNHARYLQTACSRGAYPPSNLQGIWNNYVKPMWNSDYHNDINLAMNYWMVETTNLNEMFEPYANWMKVIAQSGEYTAKEGFGVNKGWTAGLNGNIFGFTAQNAHGRRMQHSGAWLCQNLYEHFSFSRDKEYLKDIYPIIKGAAEFYLGFLAEWKDGTLVVYPTWSPENTFLEAKYGEYNKLAYGASYDQQLIYNLFVDCIEASVLLNKDKAFREELKSYITKLCPQKIGRFGQLQEWPEDMDIEFDKHRHLSHLVALHPARDISFHTNKDLAKAAHLTLSHRDGENSGWASAWRMALWARMFEGDKALAYYNTLCSKRTNRNLFNGSDIFQIDGNFGGAAGVAEMLLQSHLRSINSKATKIEDAVFPAYKTQGKNLHPIVPNDSLANAPHIIDLLPALPTTWANGTVKGLRARGGFDVDIKWANGKVVDAIIHSKAGEPFRVYVNGKLSPVVKIEKGKSIKLASVFKKN